MANRKPLVMGSGVKRILGSSDLLWAPGGLTLGGSAELTLQAGGSAATITSSASGVKLDFSVSGGITFSFGASGELLVGGSDAGDANQLFLSGGAGAAPFWSDLKTINGNSLLGSGNIVISGGGGGGSGDLVGPSSSVDNGLMTFDGTTGKLAQGPAGMTAVSTSTTSDLVVSLPGDAIDMGSYGGVRSVRMGSDISSHGGEFAVFEMLGTSTVGSATDTTYRTEVYTDGMAQSLTIVDPDWSSAKTLQANLANITQSISTTDLTAHNEAYAVVGTSNTQAGQYVSYGNTLSGKISKGEITTLEESVFFILQNASNGFDSADATQITITSGIGSVPHKSQIVLERWDNDEYYTSSYIRLEDNVGLTFGGSLDSGTPVDLASIGLRSGGAISINGSVGAANQFLISGGTGAAAGWTTLKTINGNSLLGSGDLTISGGGGGSGDFVGPSSSIDNQIVLFDGSTGKLGKAIPLYGSQLSSTIAAIASIDALVMVASSYSIAILANGELQLTGNAGAPGQVLTSGGSGAAATWGYGPQQIIVSATEPASPTLYQLWLDIS